MDFFKDILAMLADFLRIIFGLIGKDTSGIDKIFPPEGEAE